MNKKNVLKNLVKTLESSSIQLDDKVDAFIEWYYENMVKGNYTDIGEYHQPREMRNFIEKMAVWYELRYPEYEINKIMNFSPRYKTSINAVMFKYNPYIKDLFNENSDIRELDWAEFYNASTFINSLSIDEKWFFQEYRYVEIVSIKNDSISAYLQLTKNGIVEMSEDIEVFTNSIIKDKELEGLHVRKVVELFKERGIELPKNNELEKTIENEDKWIYNKEEMLNCVMYRIIERGGNRIGPRRAFLFAKEFGRNIDIPMMYAVDYSDPGLRRFMNEYIKAGGSKELECYVGYFSTTGKEKLDTISIQELILTNGNDAATFYTPEEDKLHQRLVNVLASKVDQDVVKQEDVKRLRLEKK